MSIFALVLAAFFAYGCYLEVNNTGSIALTIFVILVIACISSIFAIFAQITYSNAAMLELYELIMDRVPSSPLYERLREDCDETPLMDYEILGGKKECKWVILVLIAYWLCNVNESNFTPVLALVDDTPIFWTVYGLALTPDVLKSLVAGSVTTIAGSLVSYGLSTITGGSSG